MINEKELIVELEKIAELHPYKVIGDFDTYSEYNMAWQNCMDLVLQTVEAQSQHTLEMMIKELEKECDANAGGLYKEQIIEIVKRGAYNGQTD